MMDILLITTILSITISIAAFIISAIALWQTHFSKFKAVYAVGGLQVHIYPIRGDKNRWYLASLDTPISIANEGARTGKVLGLRIRASFPDLPISNNFEILNPYCEVDYKVFDSLIQERFVWLDKAVLGQWSPFVVLPKQTVTKHFVFETRWDEPVIQENILFELEMHTDSKKKWQKIGRWTFRLTPSVWSELAEVGASFICHENVIGMIQKESINPPDLHKYTGTKDPIPRGGFRAKPSYLDYSANRIKRRKKAE